MATTAAHIALTLASSQSQSQQSSSSQSSGGQSFAS